MWNDEVKMQTKCFNDDKIFVHFHTEEVVATLVTFNEKYDILDGDRSLKNVVSCKNSFWEECKIIKWWPYKINMQHSFPL